ncbi:hypothetical protein PRZ48_013412 [Zasmidium cellare]|uniref:Amino acid transporter n=1 Tax=Zasmidium cellare TaxID=395010 RepID=A0ABR0E1D6_ZASCE|nr:hypothetical protein PRZ48_013412 [Zasmidium cellare]
MASGDQAFEMAKLPNSSTVSDNGQDTPQQETFLDPGEWDALDPVAKEGFTVQDQRDMKRMGKQQQFRRNFKFITTSIVALDCYLVGTIVQALITINNESYSATRWQATLLIFASVIGIGIFNVVGVKHLPLAEGVFVASHFFAFFPVIIVILVLAPKTGPKEVFLTFTDNGSGWPSIGWATLVGQLSAMFSVLGSDSVAHMAEEVEDAGRVVPRSMVWSFILNIPFTFGMVISYLFCMDSIGDALEDPTGYPFIYVFRQATSSRGGTTGMTVVILFLLIMITISAMASTSRQTFAFARDNGLPFSSWLGAVHPTWHVPLNSIIFTMIFTIIISLINIGSTAAFNAMLSLSTVALMATYVVSVTCVLIRRIRGQYLPAARWSLGRWGLPVNALALVYACWSFFWSFWPNAYSVNAENFNWACVLFVGLMGIGTILYFTHARKIYDGPVAIVKDEAELR